MHCDALGVSTGAVRRFLPHAGCPVRTVALAAGAAASLGLEERAWH